MDRNGHKSQTNAPTQTDTQPLFLRRETHSKPKFGPCLLWNGHEEDTHDARLLLPLAHQSMAYRPVSSSHRQPAHLAAQFRCPGQPSVPTYLPPSTPPSNIVATIASPRLRRSFPDIASSTTSLPRPGPAWSRQKRGDLTHLMPPCSLDADRACYLVQGRCIALHRPASSMTPASCSTICPQGTNGLR